MTCSETDGFQAVPRKFKTPRDIMRLKLPLFRGTSPHDHQISPMREIEFPLDAVISEGTPYNLLYAMTRNKTIELKVVFHTANGDVEKAAQASIWR